ncbi:MAG: NAD-binding protein [Promethearchaeia archaeon]
MIALLFYIIDGSPKNILFKRISVIPADAITMEKVKITEKDCVLNLIKDVTHSVLIAKRIRELNPKCKIICRVFMEGVAEMLEKPPFKCEVISSSRATLEILIKKGLLDF